MPCRTVACAYGITVRCGSALGHGVPPVHASRYSVPSEPRALSAIRAEVLSENAPVGLARDAAAHRWQQVRCNPLSTLRLTLLRESTPTLRDSCVHNRRGSQRRYDGTGYMQDTMRASCAGICGAWRSACSRAGGSTRAALAVPNARS